MLVNKYIMSISIIGIKCIFPDCIERLIVHDTIETSLE